MSDYQGARLETLDRVREQRPEYAHNHQTAFGQLEIAVQVMRHPGGDYLANLYIWIK